MGIASVLAATVISVSSPHPELGTIEWRRGYDAAKAEAERSGKPLFVLFDEVPGCSTVRGYGARVLSHPLIREAVEEHFVNVVVYNNVGGDDRRVLNAFDEPTWNNPAVRILNGDGRALAPRLYGDYTVAATAWTMVRALESAGKPIPTYLELLAAPRTAERATYQMYCFWSGEVALGGVDGVVATKPGFASGEVVRVDYDPEQVSLDELDRVARRANAKRVSNTGFSSSRKDDKYQLRRSLLRFVPMTETQASRVNAALGSRSNAIVFLSRGQLEIYRAVKQSGGKGWSSAIARADFIAAYAEAEARAQTVLAAK